MRRRPPRSTRTDTRFPYTTRFRSGGRIGEAGAHRLAQQLRGADLPMARLKTGTPPRLDGRTINWAQLDEQPSDSGDWTCSTRSEEHTSELQSLMRISYAVFCLKQKKKTQDIRPNSDHNNREH